MKAIPLLLAGSLVANAVLVGTLGLRSPSPDAATALSPAGATGSASQAAGDGSLGALLKSDDPAALRDALRAAGVPEDIVRQIVSAKIWSRYNARMKELAAARRSKAPYWRVGASGSEQGLTADQRTELRELSRAAREQMAGLFGAAESNDALAARYDFLPPAKAGQLRDLERDYDELRLQVQQDSQGFRTAADTAKLKLLDQEKARDLAALLTPEELAAYDRRNSPTAQRLRNQLAQFDASESEYQAIYNLQKAFDLKFNPGDSPLSGVRFFDADAARARSEGEKQLQADLKSALGDQRYTDYVRAQDQDYRALTAAAQRYNLPQASIDQVYATRDTATAAAQRIADDTTMKPDQKRDAIVALATPLRSQILEALGPDIGQAYLDNAGNRWLQPLEHGSAVMINPNGGMIVRSFSPATKAGPGGPQGSGTMIIRSSPTTTPTVPGVPPNG